MTLSSLVPEIVGLLLKAMALEALCSGIYLGFRDQSSVSDGRRAGEKSGDEETEASPGSAG